MDGISALTACEKESVVIGMKKYAMYVVVGCLLFSSFISAFVFRLGRNTHVFLEVDVPRNQSTKQIKNVEYGFRIGEEGVYLRPTSYQWRAVGQGKQLATKFIKQTYEPTVYEEMHPYTYELEVLYDKDTMPKDKAHRKIIDGPAHSFYEATVSSLTYHFKLQKTHKEKLGIDTTVTIPMGKEGILVTYLDDPSSVTPDYSAFAGSAQHRLGNLINAPSGNSGLVSIKKDSYIMVNALQFKLPPKMIQTDTPIGGIYKIAENGKVTQILATDMRKENVLALNSYGNELLAICEKEGKVSIRVYTADGTLKQETPIPLEASSLTLLQLQTQADGVVVIPYQRIEDGYAMQFLVFDKEKGKLKQLDAMQYKVDEEVYDFLYRYDKKDNVLYTLLHGNGSLYLTALNQKGTLFHASIYGDYQEDQRLAVTTKGLAANSMYEVLISPLLNTGQRDISDIYLEIVDHKN